MERWKHFTHFSTYWYGICYISSFRERLKKSQTVKSQFCDFIWLLPLILYLSLFKMDKIIRI